MGFPGSDFENGGCAVALEGSRDSRTHSAVTGSLSCARAGELHNVGNGSAVCKQLAALQAKLKNDKRLRGRAPEAESQARAKTPLHLL